MMEILVADRVVMLVEEVRSPIPASESIFQHTTRAERAATYRNAGNTLHNFVIWKAIYLELALASFGSYQLALLASI